MIDYEELPTVELTLDEFNQLEDRSMCIGDDRVVGKRFRVNLRFSGSPNWVLGTFYEDEHHRRLDEEAAEKWKGTPLAESLLLSHWMRVKWERIVFPGKQLTWFGIVSSEQLTWFERLKAKVFG